MDKRDKRKGQGEKRLVSKSHGRNILLELGDPSTWTAKSLSRIIITTMKELL